jgi:nucleotide-binding universal stress UspA family protein
MTGESYRRVLIALDGSAMAEKVLPLVRPILSTFGATAIVAHVLPAIPGSPQVTPRAYLNVVTRKLESRGIKVEGISPKGDPALELLRSAEAEEVDLIALSTHGRGALARWALGSVAHKVLRASPVPILLAKGLGRPMAGIRRILVPMDGSRRSEEALPHAVALARVYGAGILLLHVAPEPGAEASDSKFRRWVRNETARVESRFATIRDAIDTIPVRTAVDRGDPALRITNRAGDRPDTMIVLSSHGRTGIARWAMGSVAEKVLHRTPAPMLMVKSFPA